MKQAIAIATIACVAEASLPLNKINHLAERGVDIERLFIKSDHYRSKAAQSLHHATLKSKRIQAGHQKRQELRATRLGASNDDEFDAVADELTSLICDIDGENCTEDKIDWVRFGFDVVKGLVVGVTAVYSEDCRGGLIGVVDGGLAMYDNIQLYLPKYFNKFGMAFNELTEAGNIVFALCDMAHFYGELTKLGEWQNWEQYVVLAGRIGGVFISDFQIQLAIIKDASFAGDGFATGSASGHLVSLMLDSIL